MVNGILQDMGCMAVIHMGGESIGLVGGSSLPTPGRARNGRLSAGAEYSSVHPPPTTPSPQRTGRQAAPHRPSLALKSSLLETFTFLLHPPEQLGQAGRASRTHIFQIDQPHILAKLRGWGNLIDKLATDRRAPRKRGRNPKCSDQVVWEDEG